MASSSALCTLAGARLISSAKTRLAKIGPSLLENWPGALVVDHGAGEIGRQQVRRELDARELGGDDVAQRAHREGLGQPGTPSSKT